MRRFAAVAIALVLAGRLEAQTPRLTFDQTMGRYVSSGMTMVNVTQDSLARLLPWLGSSQSARVNRLSAIRNGQVHESDSVLTRLAVALDSMFYARADTTVVFRASMIYQAAHRISRPPPPPIVYPVTPIVNQSMTSGLAGGDTYQINSPAHGLASGQKVIVRGHRASPLFDGATLYVTVLNTNIVRLYRDAARTQVVVVTIAGVAGTVQRQP